MRDAVKAAVVLGLGAIVAVPLALYYAENMAYCTQVSGEYEVNPELAREKYGYDTFEEWRTYYMEEFDRKCYVSRYGAPYFGAP